VSPFFTIGLARSDETAALPAIEREAASLFAGWARIGFRELSPHELPPELQAVIREEASRGLDPAARLVMVASLGSD